jgi:WhiB family redox-sensing transcriptional regulator
VATDLSWRSQSKCRGMDPQLFYPQVSNNGKVRKEARDACKECPVINQCYDYALRNEVYGFWAGLDERERESRRRAAGIAPKKWLYDTRMFAPHGTFPAYRRHVRAGEDPCQACKEAHARFNCPDPSDGRLVWI